MKKEKNTAFILLFGKSSAFNDGGGKHQSRNPAGAAYRKGPNNPGFASATLTIRTCSHCSFCASLGL
jgi:hypothetical protein